MNGLKLSGLFQDVSRDSGYNKLPMMIISAFKWFSIFLFLEEWK